MKVSFLKLTFIFLISCNVMLNAQQQGPKPRQYNLQQATSERAQLHTVAFSALAFMTGNFGADTFFPPGKVADFFGFQFMRDNDKNGKGHNTDFLTSIANSVHSVLTPEQLTSLKQLARQQAPVYDAFAFKRFELIRSFRDFMEKGIRPDPATIQKIGAELYRMDAELSFNRALTVGKIIQSFTPEQKKALAVFQFDNSSTWLNIPEQLNKQELTHREHVCVMTYLSELFSWYAGSAEADVYFCPERHATYFGGFYMKDFPAMGNPGYNISTALTGDAGRDFIAALNPEQAEYLYLCMKKQAPLLQQIVEIRMQVVDELRKAMTQQELNREMIFTAIMKYGELDAEMSFYEAEAFASIYSLLSSEQKNKLKTIRNQDQLPEFSYLFSDPLKKGK
jgi:hypothetical protein